MTDRSFINAIFVIDLLKLTDLLRSDISIRILYFFVYAIIIAQSCNTAVLKTKDCTCNFRLNQAIAAR